MTQTVLPIFPAPGSRVSVPDRSTGGRLLTWTMGEARTVDGEIVIRCVGMGDVKAQEVKRK
jgi:hypothetical protein